MLSALLTDGVFSAHFSCIDYDGVVAYFYPKKYKTFCYLRYNMLFLIRGCTFSACRYYGNIINKAKSYSLYPLLFNLNIKHPPIYKLFRTERNLSVIDEIVKKYLDYLMHAYQNNNNKAIEGITEILKLKMVPVLLDKKIKISENIKNLNDLVSDDEEMKKLAKEEESTYRQELLETDLQLLDTISQSLGVEKYDNVIIEIVPGVGGVEAMLFAKDLFEMYLNYLNYLELTHEVIQLDSEKNGLRRGEILISDSDAFEKLKYEGGVHRVQRVPSTERSGRMHTSTAVVTIIPEPRDVDIDLQEKDLKIETKRATGAGGQHVNTTNSAVRIIHIPTGITVTCQTDRSQIQNRKLAMMKLKGIMYQEQLDKQASFINEMRRRQMGTKLRNEKIRTYNFNQDRVTDHRIPDGTMHNLKEFMKGGAPLIELQERLYRDMQQQTLLEIIKKTAGELK